MFVDSGSSGVGSDRLAEGAAEILRQYKNIVKDISNTKEG